MGDDEQYPRDDDSDIDHIDRRPPTPGPFPREPPPRPSDERPSEEHR